jgi:hemolysin D
MERARAELAASSAGEADGSADPPPAEIAERSGRLRSGRAVSPSADLARAQRLQLASSLTEWRNHLRAAEAAVAERRAAADIARAELARAETAAALASETYAARRRLLDAGAIAELDAREAQSRAVEAAAAADAARIRVRQELAASEAAARRVDALRAERRRRSAAELSALALRLHDQIADAEDRSADDSAGLAAAVARRSAALAALAEARAQLRASRTDRARAQAKELIALASQAATLRAELTRAEHGVRAARLIAPIDGVAQQVGVHGPGAAVMPGQALLVVIPRNGAVEIEAWFANRDAAHVRAGQEVDVRADALPFTRFGVSRGIVAVIASNAVDLGHVGAAYPATIRLIGGIPAGADPSVANRLVPGMTVSVDAKITRRRVLDFVLSPILETLHSAARVR